ncbi:MAG: glutamate--tRNA ligase [Actinobacteria bacterium]|nr:glutamate--tRNA ligase [Actinomycetota bacterium]
MPERNPSDLPPGGPVPGPVRVRFAPSPTGTLHIGSARTALYNYLFARHMGGSYILRIEDTDVARSSRAHEQSILADLAWLGLEWDEGPDIGGDYGPYRQSERSDAGIYRRAAERLLKENKAYYCFCSQERLEELKKEAQVHGDAPGYDRSCDAIDRAEAAARVADGEPATIRFRVPRTDIVVTDIIHGPTEFNSAVIGDFIILRSEGGVSYNFAVVVDDIAMEITHVIRGEDHLTNAARQVLVFQALGHEPPAWAHHSLVMGPDGGKLSKRHGATSVGDFRGMGYLSSAIINYLALLSWSPSGDQEKLAKGEMVEDFELQRVAKSPAIFDIAKLNWLNGLHIRDLEPAVLREALRPFLKTGAEGLADAAASGAVDVSDELGNITEGQLAVAEAAVQTSLVTLADAGAQIREFFTLSPLAESECLPELKEEGSAAVLEMVLAGVDRLPDAGSIAADGVAEQLESARALLKEWKKVCKKADIPPKRLFRTLRIALTGRTSGPELPFLLVGLGSATVRERLEAARPFSG